MEKANVVRDDWNGYNVLHDSASRVAALDLGFLPSARASSAPAPKVVYLVGSDDFSEADVPNDAFVIYQVCLFTFWAANCAISDVALHCSISCLQWPPRCDEGQHRLLERGKGFILCWDACQICSIGWKDVRWVLVCLATTVMLGS